MFEDHINQDGASQAPRDHAGPLKLPRSKALSPCVVAETLPGFRRQCLIPEG